MLPDIKSLRKAQTKANVEAWLRPLYQVASWSDYGCPTVEIIEVREDRCLLSYSVEFEEWLRTGMDRWDLLIGKHKPIGRKTAVKGWRERRATWAAQIIHHYDVEVGPFFEFDFDPHNPNWGLFYTILHIKDAAKEKLTGRRVDPFKVAKALRKRGLEVLDVRQTPQSIAA